MTVTVLRGSWIGVDRFEAKAKRAAVCVAAMVFSFSRGELPSLAGRACDKPPLLDRNPLQPHPSSNRFAPLRCRALVFLPFPPRGVSNAFTAIPSALH